MLVLSHVNKALVKLMYWRRIHAEREELSHLSDELLKDVGISREDADREANRHFWDTAPL